MNNKKPNRKLKNYKENKSKSISKRKLKGGHSLPIEVLDIYVLFFVTMLLKPYISFMKSWCNYYFQDPKTQAYLIVHNLLSYFQIYESGILQFDKFNAITNFIKLFYFNFNFLYDKIISTYSPTTTIHITTKTSLNDDYMNRYSNVVHNTLVNILGIMNPNDPSLDSMFRYLDDIYSISLDIDIFLTVQVIKKYLLRLKQADKDYILYTSDRSYNTQLYFIYGLYCFAAFNYELFETMKKYLVTYNPGRSYPDIHNSRFYDELLDIEFYDYFNNTFYQRPTLQTELETYFTGTNITISNRRRIVESLLNIDNEISSIRMIIRHYPQSKIVQIVAEKISYLKILKGIQYDHSVAKTRYQQLLATVNRIIAEKERVSNDLIDVNRILEQRQKYYDKLKKLNEKK